MHTFCQHFTENHYSFSIKYWLFSYLFLPPFLVLMPLLDIINFWPLKQWGCLRGKLSSEAEKMQFLKLNLQNFVHIFCQHFTENPLFFSNEILTIIMSIPPTFPFFFYDIGYYHVYSSNVSCFNAFAELLYKPFFHWREDRSVCGESAPSEADRNNAIFNSICTGTRRYSDTP